MIFTNRAQKYFFNALLLSASSIALRAIGVAFNAYISERLGAQGMGLLTLMGGIFGFSITLAAAGINLGVHETLGILNVPETEGEVYDRFVV